MPFEQFVARFGELGWKETRTATTMNHSGLPNDSYGLIEMYCNDKDCDCRRVIFEVITEKQKTPIAYVSFGWEDVAFYTRWLGGHDKATAKQLKGPILNPGSPQSKLAPAILKLIQEEVLQEKNYVARIKRHYKMFKETVDHKPVRMFEQPEISTNDSVPAETPAPKSRKRHRPRNIDN